MPKWIDTRYHYFEFGYNYDRKVPEEYFLKKGLASTHYYAPNMDGLFEYLNQFLFDCSQEGYEIKATMPLQSGVAHNYTQAKQSDSANSGWGWGLGYGFGVSPTTGVLVIVQRVEEVSEPEFQRRREKRAFLVDINTLEAAQPLLEEKLSAAEKALLDVGEVKEKKKLLGSGAVFSCGGKKFDTREEAQAHWQSFVDAVREAKKLLSENQRAVADFKIAVQELDSLET